MIGSVAPAMKRDVRVPAAWVLRAKLTGTLPPVGHAAVGHSRPAGRAAAAGDGSE